MNMPVQIALRTLLGVLLLAWSIPTVLCAQQLRVVHVNADKFPSIDVTLEINGTRHKPERNDFVVKTRQRPLPFELLIHKAPDADIQPGKKVLIVLDAGPWAAGNRILEMKKPVLQLMDMLPANTAFAFGWCQASDTKPFVSAQPATTDAELLREAVQRVYSSGDTTLPMAPAFALRQAIEWFADKDDESLREIIYISPAGGVVLADEEALRLQKLLDDSQMRLHLALYKPQHEAVADQLREFAASTRGKALTATNIAGLQNALEAMLGITAGSRQAPSLYDYTVIVRFESDEPETGENKEATIRYQGKNIPVTYVAASVAYRQDGPQGLLDRYRYHLLAAGGALLTLLIFIGLLRRQLRMRRELKVQRKQLEQANQRMQTQLMADTAQREQIAAHVTRTNTLVNPQPVNPRKPQVQPTRLVAHLMGMSLEFMLAGNVLTLGRNSANDITLGHASVSSHHAVLQLRDGLWWIHDLNSEYGIRHNNQPTIETSLAVGDRLHIGDVLLEVK